MSAYYNDNEKFVCIWLKSLIQEGLISGGDVDERSIKEIKGEELASYTRVHLFAGIGGWDYALRLAGWPDGLPIWTGSCPCQPFSAAGKRKGVADERHLWPEFRRLIQECRPPIVVGEQVSGKDGRAWCRGVRFDMEELGYDFAAFDLCAASVGAPHKRQRLWWVALSHGGNSEDGNLQRGGEYRQQQENSGSGGMEYATYGRGFWESGTLRSVRPSKDGGVGHSQRRGYEGGSINREATEESGVGHVIGFWDSSYPINCKDGKTRRIPIESALFPLADGIPNRRRLIRGAGNAIVPQVAAVFLMSIMDVLDV